MGGAPTGAARDNTDMSTTTGGNMSSVLAYTYDAAYHCPTCARARFGADELGFVPADAQDSEGNPVGAVVPWDEWYQGTGGREVLACDTCGDELDELVPDEPAARWTVIENTPGYLPDDDDPPTFESYADAVRYLNDRAQEYADDPDANYRVEYGWASGGNYAAVMVHDDDREHDLGRWIGVERVDDDEDEDDEPADERAPADYDPHAVAETTDPDELIAPERILRGENILPVARVTVHPAGRHPGSPIVDTMPAVELETTAGSRWFGILRGWIGADLQVHVIARGNVPTLRAAGFRYPAPRRP